MLLTSFMILLILSSVAFASEYETSGKAGDYTVRVLVDKNPLARGLNNMKITVTDGASKTVPDAQVQVDYLMPSLPGRKPMMQYSTTATRQDKYYLARIDLSMAGEWTVGVKVTRGDKTGTMKFTLVVN